MHSSTIHFDGAEQQARCVEPGHTGHTRTREGPGVPTGGPDERSYPRTRVFLADSRVAGEGARGLAIEMYCDPERTCGAGRGDPVNPRILRVSQDRTTHPTRAHASDQLSALASAAGCRFVIGVPRPLSPRADAADTCTSAGLGFPCEAMSYCGT